LAGTDLTLKWYDNSTNEEGFSIEASQDGVTFTRMAGVGANTATFLLPGLRNKMSFRVVAYNGAGLSGYTNAVTVDPFPRAPSGLTASLSGSSLTLRWYDNAANEAGYVLESSADGVNFTSQATLAPNTNSMVLNVGTPFRPIYFRVRAYNGAGVSAPSNVATVYPAASPINATLAAGMLTIK
jgi:hypothetical protein